MEEAIHRSVMPEETLKFLKVKKNGIYVDCTFGNGGHSKMILEKINDGKLVAFE
jgi:16S rRNA (cytosine1402-N4)-methyltransferase